VFAARDSLSVGFWKAVEADSKQVWTPARLVVRYFVTPTVSASVLLRASEELLRRSAAWPSRLVRSRLANKHGVHIAEGARIGSAFRMPHPVGIVIGPGVIVGDRVSIYQGVTLGASAPRTEPWVFPVIEDDVTIYANSVVAGDIVIGAGATVAAGAIVTESVPQGATVVGVNRLVSSGSGSG
jgi:serine O-acetyltransferase